MTRESKQWKLCFRVRLEKEEMLNGSAGYGSSGKNTDCLSIKTPNSILLMSIVVDFEDVSVRRTAAYLCLLECQVGVHDSSDVQEGRYSKQAERRRCPSCNAFLHEGDGASQQSHRSPHRLACVSA